VGVLLAALADVPASATSDANHDPNNYLALGDSVMFGYSPLLVRPGVDPKVFVGYPELASDLFRPRKKMFNASCPGETSTSLITGVPPDNGCHAYRQFIGPLHVSYSGSQLAYAVDYIKANPRTGLVTLTIGANDLFLLIDSCAGSTNVTCVVAGLPALLSKLATNVDLIYSSLRAAGFQGDLVAVTYYAGNYSDPSGVAVISQINGVLASVTRSHGGKVAPGFEELQAAASSFGGDSCAAGLLIRLTPTSCDVHPSPEGAALLADAVRDAA
jgi:lysophospholipase L1-like esterase